MIELAQEHKRECDLTIALLKEPTINKQVLSARIKKLDSIRCDEETPPAMRKAIASYLIAAIESAIPHPLRLRAHYILFEKDANDPDSQLGKTGVLYSYADALETPTNMSWVIDGLFTPASTNLLVGDGGTKKTYSMIDLCVAVARGSDSWLEFNIPKPLVCLFVDEESGPRRFAERLQKVGMAHEAESELPLYYISLAGFDLTTTDGQDKLHELVAETNAGLVILDALVDVMAGGDENAVSDVQPVFVGLRRIAEMTHSAILVIHHTNRTGGYRGSSALKGAVDTMLIVQADGDLLTFKTEKARDIEFTTFHAITNFGQGTFNLSPTMGTRKVDKVQPMIVSWLKMAGEMTRSELVDVASTHDIGRNAVDEALKALVFSNSIEAITQAHGTKVFSLPVFDDTDREAREAGKLD